MQQGINWWGPEFLVEFDITVTASEFPKVLYNVFQVSKERPGGIGPRQENIPGVWVIRNLPDNVQTAAHGWDLIKHGMVNAFRRLSGCFQVAFRLLEPYK